MPPEKLRLPIIVPVRAHVTSYPTSFYPIDFKCVCNFGMLELGIGVELCWPHSPQQKGAVENLVGFVKSSFFKVRRFHDQEDLEQQLVVWHREVNQERPCRATGIIPAVRLAEEAPRLRWSSLLHASRGH